MATTEITALDSFQANPELRSLVYDAGSAVVAALAAALTGLISRGRRSA